jgi:mannose-6-phosphate isomerase-like protein (cupin superfamily)
MPRQEISIVRYGELRPCRTAFIDAHTPGSDRKENFSIIGAGVTESADQHVHVRATPGFNVGAAGQPPGCRNSLHSHRTAEVFFVLRGRWRFFWGLHGDAGEVVLEEGDLINIPTGIFRGFENVGIDYGMIMSILGGDDAGGGVVWAPQVIEEARAHGLVLGTNGRIYDTRRGEGLPASVQPMQPLAARELEAFPEFPVERIVRGHVARHLDLAALSARRPVLAIGAEGVLRDRPGFEVEYLSAGSIPGEAYATPRHEVLMVFRGHWRLRSGTGEDVLAPGDVCAVPPGLAHALEPAMTGEAGLFRVRNTDDPAGPTRSTG